MKHEQCDPLTRSNGQSYNVLGNKTMSKSTRNVHPDKPHWTIKSETNLKTRNHSELLL